MKTQISLEEIYSPISEHFPLVEEKIFEILATENNLSREIVSYFFKAKGKFLRPGLCLFAAGLSDQIDPKIIQNAAALEIFHSATLIHDDIIDSSYLRRNMPTVNAVWNSQIAVLVGDYLHDKAIHSIFSLKNERAFSIFLETAGIVCDGEILELHEKGNFQLKEEQYLTIIERKTAVLLACCLETSAILSGLTLEQAKSLRNFGTYFGIAFQIIDDCLDFSGKENEFGKTLGADCAAGVLTLPLIRLLSRLEEKKKNEIIRMIRGGFDKENFPPLVQMLQETDSLGYSFRKAREYTDRARLELSTFKDHPVKQSLNSLLDYIIERNR